MWAKPVKKTQSLALHRTITRCSDDGDDADVLLPVVRRGLFDMTVFLQRDGYLLLLLLLLLVVLLLLLLLMVCV
jgi:hypothetical protein